MKPIKIFLLFVVGAAFLWAGAVLVWQSLSRGPAPAGQPPTAGALSEPRELPSFHLRGPAGEFGNAQLLGHWSFLFLGYTQCPDVCPTALSMLKEVRATVGAEPAFDVVFVSVDPRRDTPDLLRQYLAAFDPGFIGISGDDAALAPLVKALGATYTRHDKTDERRYTVDHTAAIYLIDTRGRVAAEFSPPQMTSALVAGLRNATRVSTAVPARGA